MVRQSIQSLVGERGQTLVEYALIVSALSMTVAALLIFKLNVIDLYEGLVAELSESFS